MKEDIYEPLERYVNEFKEKFSQIADKTFDEFVECSNVDISANRRTVAEIEQTENKKSGLQFRHSLLVFCAVILWIAVAASAVYACCIIFGDKGPKEHLAISLAVFAFALFLLLVLVHPRISELGGLIEKLEQKICELKNTAWQQMSALNELFTWELLPDMMNKCVPGLEFDHCFFCGRLKELEDEFGWNGEFNDDISILFAHSGVINGNPFALFKYRSQVWGNETYSGTKTISYYETVRDADGKSHRELRYQTLVATVTKPKPEYIDRSAAVYGNDAAPELEFSREPSEYSGENGFISNIFKKRELKKLEKFARNLEDDSNFTMMSNKEFEVLFHADDRTDEVQFRLLFTPLAQQQMVRLLNDKEHGYGDDFSFVKSRKINMVFPHHLNEIDIDTDPGQFRHFSFDRIKDYFAARTNEYFKAVYFAFAPLLTIPLYQQTRSFNTIYGDVDKENISFWEVESFVNYLGEQKFKHPKSITCNILKTTDCTPSDGGNVTVEAHGFKGVERTDFVPVYGNDGKWHNVPVDWIEYIPVSRRSSLDIALAEPQFAADDTVNIRRRLYVRS